MGGSRKRLSGRARRRLTDARARVQDTCRKKTCRSSERHVYAVYDNIRRFCGVLECTSAWAGRGAEACAVDPGSSSHAAAIPLCSQLANSPPLA